MTGPMKSLLDALRDHDDLLRSTEPSRTAGLSKARLMSLLGIEAVDLGVLLRSAVSRELVACAGPPRGGQRVYWITNQGRGHAAAEGERRRLSRARLKAVAA